MKRKHPPLFTPAERVGLITAIVISASILLAKAGCSRGEVEDRPERENVSLSADTIRLVPASPKARRDTLIKTSRKAKKRVPPKQLPARNPLDEVL